MGFCLAGFISRALLQDETCLDGSLTVETASRKPRAEIRKPNNQRLILPVHRPYVCGYHGSMRYSLRFLWNATKGHRLAPWRSPYLLWRIETYTGVKMTQIGFLEFWEFMWRERRELWLFLKWTGDMERYVHPKPKSS
jgi:hypothetical protein